MRSNRAIDTDEFAGCVAYFSPLSTKHPLFQGNCAHIQLLGVRLNRRNSGIGRMLLEHCLTQARRDRAEVLLLQTSEFMPEARRLYASLGFQVRKELAPVWGVPPYLYAKSTV